jgi:hypothetical protein
MTLEILARCHVSRAANTGAVTRLDRIAEVSYMQPSCDTSYILANNQVAYKPLIDSARQAQPVLPRLPYSSAYLIALCNSAYSKHIIYTWVDPSSPYVIHNPRCFQLTFAILIPCQPWYCQHDRSSASKTFCRLDICSTDQTRNQIHRTISPPRV